MELVSAIITTHNRIELLEMAIRSVRNQSYKNIELIVVDDASDDNNRFRAEQIINEIDSENCKYIYIPKNESTGGNHARNIGINASSGEYVAFLDDDDEWFPEKIAKQVEFFEKYDEYKAVHCACEIELNYEKIRHCKIDTFQEGDIRISVWEKSAPFITSCVMIRREVFDIVGLFDEKLKYWQEYELSIRIGEITKLGFVPEELVKYRKVYTDSNRLTNKLTGWEDAVSYIEVKHKGKMDRLTSNQLKSYKKRVYKEGAMRAYIGKSYKVEREYLWKMFLVDKSPKSFLKWLFNRYALRVW